MSEPFTRLPDCDAIKGAALIGQIFEFEYERASDQQAYVLSMSLANAEFLLALLADLPDADRIFREARAIRAAHPIRLAPRPDEPSS